MKVASWNMGPPKISSKKADQGAFSCIPGGFFMRSHNKLGPYEKSFMADQGAFSCIPGGFYIRVSHKSTFFEIRNEYPWKLFLLGHWYWKYKFFHSNPLFSSSPGFLTVLHLPSGVENFFVDNPPLSYIKSCVLACRLQIWTSFLVLPKQNIE